MAFQPFTLSKPTGVDALFGGPSPLNALVEAQKIKRDKDQVALENLRQSNQDKRQSQLDYQNTLLKAQALAAPGPGQDLQAAAALMAPYSAQQMQREVEESKPWGPTAAPMVPPAAGQAPPAPPAFQGDQGETPPDVAAGPPPPPQPAAQAPISITPPPFNADAAPAFEGDQGDTPPEEPAPTAAPAAMAPPPAAPNPLVAAAQKDTAQKKRMATYLTGRGPNGEVWTLDPEAVASERQRRADDAFTQVADRGGYTGDLIRELYPQMRAAAIASGHPLDAEETMKFIQGEGKARRAAQSQDAKEREWRETFDQRDKLRHDALKQSDTNSIRSAEARKAAAAMMANTPNKNDARTTADSSNLGNAVKNFWQEFDGKALLKSDRLLNAAISNVAAKGPEAVMSHKDAFFGLERYFRGGIPTDSETQLLVKHMGGIPGAIDQYIKDFQTGDFSGITIRNIAAAAARAKAENDNNKTRLMTAAAKRFGPNSEFRLMGPNVNAYMGAMADSFNMDVPDLYPTGTGGEGATIGSGERPNVGQAPRRLPAAGAKPGAKPGGKSAPLPNSDYMKMLK